jgi:hypothetical protein
VPDGELEFCRQGEGVCQLKLVAKGKPAHAVDLVGGGDRSLIVLGSELLRFMEKITSLKTGERR